MSFLEKLKTINLLTIVVGILVVFLVSYFGPGIIKALFAVGQELGEAIGDVIWG